MYNIIEKDTSFELTEKKSKFITNLVVVKSIKEANEKIILINKKYHDARHNCYAFRVLENKNEVYEKSSDDGEPSGTAGLPILNILKKNNLVNCLIVVTRYFGGILLGTGGLVRAYSESAIGAIKRVDKFEYEFETQFKIAINYSDFQSFQHYCKNNDIRIIDTVYDENIIVNVIVKEIFQSAFRDDLWKWDSLKLYEN